MNTPSHVIYNMAMWGTERQRHRFPVFLGAIAPDVPIFAFYAIAKFAGYSDSDIWRDLYFQSWVQDLLAPFHAIPLIGLGVVIAWRRQAGTWLAFFISAMLHVLFDFPVHNSDAHRHFFPLSNYRFISPISYWDPDHYGRIIAPLELLSVLVLTLFLYRSVRSRWGRGLLVSVNAVYLAGCVYFYVL
ncbi:MAG: hypothetical protein AAF974_11065 [Cyanobacteria bacterium P01_E01_bin.34]